MAVSGLSIIIAHGSDDVRQDIASAIDERHSVIETTGTVAEFKELVLEHRPQLLIAGVYFPDGHGIDAAIELGRKYPVPTVVVTAARSLSLVEKAMEDHVMAYLIEPVMKEDLEAAIIVAWSRFEQLQELEGQVDDLKLALEHRKIIERAKGVLMASESVTEAEAFGLLRRRAQDERTRMVEVAEAIIDEKTD